MNHFPTYNYSIVKDRKVIDLLAYSVMVPAEYFQFIFSFKERDLPPAAPTPAEAFGRSSSLRLPKVKQPEGSEAKPGKGAKTDVRPDSVAFGTAAG